MDGLEDYPTFPFEMGSLWKGGANCTQFSGGGALGEKRNKNTCGK